MQGQVNLRFKSDLKCVPGEKIKKIPIELCMEDSRWHSKEIFEIFKNEQYKLGENKMMSPVASYYMIRVSQFN